MRPAGRRNAPGDDRKRQRGGKACYRRLGHSASRQPGMVTASSAPLRRIARRSTRIAKTTKAAPPITANSAPTPCRNMPAAAASGRRAGAGGRLARRAVTAGDEHADRGDDLAAAIKQDDDTRRPLGRRQTFHLVESEGEQHAHAGDADRRDDVVIMRRRARVRTGDEHAHHAADREQARAKSPAQRRPDRARATAPGTELARVRQQREREHQRRQHDPVLQKAEGVVLLGPKTARRRDRTISAESKTP